MHAATLLAGGLAPPAPPFVFAAASLALPPLPLACVVPPSLEFGALDASDALIVDASAELAIAAPLAPACGASLWLPPAPAALLGLFIDMTTGNGSLQPLAIHANAHTHEMTLPHRTIDRNVWYTFIGPRPSVIRPARSPSESRADVPLIERRSVRLLTRG
jgi:hypothetical protein